MDKIAINKTTVKGDATFGSLKIENVILDPQIIEDHLTSYILEEENLRFVFCEEDKSVSKMRNILVTFLPEDIAIEHVDDEYVEKQIQNHRSFYSFLAEALLPLAYRDVFGYKLAEAVLDVSDTLIDQGTGVDSCLYDKENQLFVLGEAKFYVSLKDGLNRIINDFKSGTGFFNKLESLCRTIRKNDETNSLVLRILGKENCDVFLLNDFLKLNINLAGFVLHEAGSIDLDKITEDSFYDDFELTKKDIANHLEEHKYAMNLSQMNITFFHIFVDSKKQTILSCIKKAYEKLRN